MCVSATCGVGLSIPCIAVALGDVECLRLTVVDGQVEGFDMRAACRCGGLVSVSTAYGVRSAVPYIGVALCHVECLGLAVVDGKVESLSEGAT